MKNVEFDWEIDKYVEKKFEGFTSRVKATEVFISIDHPMTKDHYLSFSAFAIGDQIQLPKWGLQTRLPKCKHGKLLWFHTKLDYLISLFNRLKIIREL
ncbi:hypothetical protein ACIQ34_09440 [Ureibacillus sp. NPDC094379]